MSTNDNYVYELMQRQQKLKQELDQEIAAEEARFFIEARRRLRELGYSFEQIGDIFTAIWPEEDDES